MVLKSPAKIDKVEISFSLNELEKEIDILCKDAVFYVWSPEA